MSARARRESLSIVVPAYNEAPVIARTIDTLRRHAEAAFPAFEIIVVDDGSRDATAMVVDAAREAVPQLRLVRFPANRGKGAAVRQGMLAAASDLLLLCDADLSTPIGELEALLARIDSGADVAIGSRSLAGSQVRVRQPLHRESLGKLYGVLMRRVTGLAFRDTQCGFKLFTRRAARLIFRSAQVDGLAFDIEALLIARRAGLRVDEVPVQWSDCPDSKVRLLTDGLAMVLDLLSMRARDSGGGRDAR